MILYSSVLLAGALPIVPAVYPDVTPFLPVAVDFPTCDSTEYASILACPRAPVICPGTSLPETDLASGSGSSGSGDEGEAFVSTLGRLTSSGQIGTRALDGVVGVRCEGTALCSWCMLLLVDLALDYTESECREFSLRMTFRERTEAAGNLEICYGNEWNIMCADLLDQNVLNVACRALGFTAFEQSIADHRFLPTTAYVQGTAFEQKLNCSGIESSLSECEIEAAPARNITNSLCLDVRIQCLGRCALEPDKENAMYCSFAKDTVQSLGILQHHICGGAQDGFTGMQCQRGQLPTSHSVNSYSL